MGCWFVLVSKPYNPTLGPSRWLSDRSNSITKNLYVAKIVVVKKTPVEEKLQELTDLVEESLPQRGNTSDECQRIALINAINTVEHLVNGIEPIDLEEKEDW